MLVRLHRNGPLPGSCTWRAVSLPAGFGVVVMIIGLSLIQVGLTSIGGGYAAMADHTCSRKSAAGGYRAGADYLNQRNPYSASPR